MVMATLYVGSLITIGYATIAEASPSGSVNLAESYHSMQNDVSLQSPVSDTEHHELLVIDAAVAERETLLKGLSPDVEVLLLGKGEGLERIADSLKSRHGLDAIHLMSHGEPGRLLLGDAAIDQSNLNQHQTELTTIGAALKEQGDLLIYGCNVAKGKKGSAFVRQLAAATDADISASDDLTGASSLGGDWVFESTYAVETRVALSDEAIAAYSETLVPVTITSNPQ
ncbi:DUF4347 domain-containing protein [Candidatus Reidiella endopervernicosa]|nr:DUF4347 domain-containing protein [Candidatus Reidiella endopervernicosa]QKQ26852.1 DUF4347 domain-containing protein [Candidatus Reidiella endopervernicosa]